MNYNLYWDGQPYGRDDLLIGTIFREPWQRPTLGAHFTIKGREVKIVRVSPTSNPANALVKYYVEPVTGNWPYRDAYGTENMQG